MWLLPNSDRRSGQKTAQPGVPPAADGGAGHTFDSSRERNQAGMTAQTGELAAATRERSARNLALHDAAEVGVLAVIS
jgi:hypothetical protein